MSAQSSFQARRQAAHGRGSQHNGTRHPASTATAARQQWQQSRSATSEHVRGVAAATAVTYIQAVRRACCRVHSCGNKLDISTSKRIGGLQEDLSFFC
jgi:hypothetical protein